jgi:energy-coupling factor transport system permease protein
MMLHPLTQITVAAALSAAGIAYSDNFILLLVLSICMVLNLISSGAHLRKLLKDSTKLLPVALGVFMIQIIFIQSGAVIVDFNLFAVTSEGFRAAVSVTLRLLIILYTAIWLSRLSIGEFKQAFRTIRLPETLSVMISLTLRFLPELYTRLKQVSFQLKTRDAGLSKWGFIKRIALFRMMVFSVLGWTLKDLKYRAVTLDFRGFRNGLKHINYVRTGLKLIDYAVIVIALAAACVPLFLLQN